MRCIAYRERTVHDVSEEQLRLVDVPDDAIPHKCPNCGMASDPENEEDLFARRSQWFELVENSHSVRAYCRRTGCNWQDVLVK